jgi:hypothetical protein
LGGKMAICTTLRVSVGTSGYQISATSSNPSVMDMLMMYELLTSKLSFRKLTTDQMACLVLWWLLSWRWWSWRGFVGGMDDQAVWGLEGWVKWWNRRVVFDWDCWGKRTWC